MKSRPATRMTATVRTCEKIGVVGGAAHLRAAGRERVCVKLIQLAAAHATQPHARHCTATNTLACKS